MQNTIETNKKRINSDLKKIDSDLVIRKKKAQKIQQELNQDALIVPK